MTIATTLALQSVPFAGLVFARSKNWDLFAVAYLSALGLILTLITLVGDASLAPADFAAITEALTTN
ncbi:hypothetical protein [Methylobacterium sp.]|jgi:hypothetical protein|uniref:hypothetical protein n=1 Tax=Methylobacterium sp. TaxID=409 RepID=UPI0026307C53|nr:hypothetical protein [Methylobacterium sp.]MDB5644510.1 hypothetical protein [Methylobacterium sp.]